MATKATNDSAASGQATNFTLINAMNIVVSVGTCSIKFNDQETISFGDVSLKPLEKKTMQLRNSTGFNDFVLQIKLDHNYGIDLNRDHWFGGAGDTHYPGTGNVFIFILGLNDENTNQLLIAYSYSAPGRIGPDYSHADIKTLDLM